eukprot:TRINITY_DN11695_c0_g1_i2.p1 TRINITY_DN11695_c0_g1~~TRINITY_DN11695_c0_g1_i2.p1  ORF type:complete len:127 (+),score=14.90 TRINITY_DN11695_c0_g1_i2:36-416(+)
MEYVQRFREFLRSIPPPKPYQRLILQFFVSILTTGIVYGWPGIVLMMNSEGKYRHLCDEATYQETGTCDERSAKLSLIWSVGMGANIASFLLYGLIIDKFGPRKTSITAICLSCLGILLFLSLIHI